MNNQSGLRAALVCGLLWGFGVMLADTLTEPIAGLTVRQWLSFTLGVWWSWTLAGLIWTVGAQVLMRGRCVPAKTALLFVLSLAAVIAGQWISPFPTARGNGGITVALVGTYPVFDLVMYLVWQNAFFGGLYLAGYLANLRIGQASRRLAEFRLARNEADFLVREARVVAFRGQLQPAMLLTAIAALQERYRSDPAGGDALFDRLIAFLRVAMPPIRSGISTLDTELETVRNYASLRRMLTVPGARWRLELPAKPPPLPFPSLILLPAMHGLGAALDERDLLTLCVTLSPDMVTLRLDADRAIHLPEQIDRRLRGGLRLTFGSAAQVSPGRRLPLTIRLFPQRIAAASPTPCDEILPGECHALDDHDRDDPADGLPADGLPADGLPVGAGR